MNRQTKIILYVVLLALAGCFGSLFLKAYQQTAVTRDKSEEADALGTKSSTAESPKVGTLPKTGHMGAYGAVLILSVVGIGLLAAHDVSTFFANRAMKLLDDDEGEAFSNPEYDQAEQEWADGNHLEAIRLMREYLAKCPKAQHVAIRIAEIYEKDLGNPLAAALEYEEVLTKKLPAENWGWAAIHLCNIYVSKLGQQEKAIALLRRIESGYGQTSAAEKARKRLAMIDGGGDPAGQTEEEADSAASTSGGTPA